MPPTQRKFNPLPYAPKIYVADQAARLDPATYGVIDQPLMVGITTVQQADDPDATYRLIANDVSLASSWEREADYSALPVEDLLGRHIYDLNLAFAEAALSASGAGVATKPDGLVITVDNTASAFAWVKMAEHAFAGLTEPPAGIGAAISWNTPTFFIVRIDFSSSMDGDGSNDRDTYIQLGRSNTEAAPGQLNARGFGIRRNGESNVRLFAHDGTVLTEDAGVSLTSDKGRIMNLVVHSDGDGEVRLFSLNQDGRLQLQATISGGPTDNIIGPDVLFEICHVNGAAPDGIAFETLITNAALGSVINPLND